MITAWVSLQWPLMDCVGCYICYCNDGCGWRVSHLPNAQTTLCLDEKWTAKQTATIYQKLVGLSEILHIWTLKQINKNWHITVENTWRQFINFQNTLLKIHYVWTENGLLDCIKRMLWLIFIFIHQQGSNTNKQLVWIRDKHTYTHINTEKPSIWGQLF